MRQLDVNIIICKYFSIYIIIINISVQALIDFIEPSRSRDIHVYMKLFRLYILLMFDNVIQRCGLVS